jgi:phosphatidylserine/phosphatidylglycerophosphate/cardiolipin synthase-like enzyme
VRGPAARDLLRIFVERWTWDAADPPALHPEVRALPADRRTLRGATLAAPAAIANATHSVQIGRTYGNGTRWAGIDGTAQAPQGYPFAPNGTQQAAQMILRGIRAARRFVYVEDQYFVDTSPGNVNLSVRDALEAALPNVEHITVLIPDSSITDLGDKLGVNQANFRRLELINYLRGRPGGDKLRVFVRVTPGDPHTYIHCKTWIFDDRYAVIGSANCNRRSFTHDSEVVAGIWDSGKADGSTLLLPHRMRMRLWAEHLNIDTLDKLEDGVASRRYWLPADRPVGAPIREYDYSNNAPVPDADDRVRWDERVDPDGS